MLRSMSQLRYLRFKAIGVGVVIVTIAILIGRFSFLYASLPIKTDATAKSSPERIVLNLPSRNVPAAICDNGSGAASPACVSNPNAPVPAHLTGKRLRRRNNRRHKADLTKRRSKTPSSFVVEPIVAGGTSAAAAITEAAIAASAPKEGLVVPIAGENDATCISGFVAPSADVSVNSAALIAMPIGAIDNHSNSNALNFTEAIVLGGIASSWMNKHEKHSPHIVPAVGPFVVGPTRPVPELPTTIVFGTMIFCGLTFFARGRTTPNAL